MSFTKKLVDPDYYVGQIAKISLKLQSKGSQFLSVNDPVPFVQCEYNASLFTKSIVQSIKEKRYKPKQATSYYIQDKSREIFSFTTIDRVVHGAVAQMLQEELKEKLSDRVYSYFPNKSYLTAIKRLARFIRHTYRKDTAAYHGELFIHRLDIKNYSDSIPLGQNAPLWKDLTHHLFPEGVWDDFERYVWQLLVSLLRPEVCNDDNTGFTKLTGAATGSPLSAILYNFAAREIDEISPKYRGLFYARYSDDIIIAHRERGVVEKAACEIESTLTKLGLEANLDKSETVCLSTSGRTKKNYNNIQAVQYIDYLGARINARGEISPGTKSARRFLKRCKSSIKHTLDLLEDESLLGQGRVVCETLNNCLLPLKDKKRAWDSMLHVFQITNDRSFLKQLDKSLELLIAQELSRKKGLRAFRDVPPKMIRNLMGLKSLYHMRNLQVTR